VIKEYSDNFKGKSGEKVTPKSGTHWKSLDDAGIEVTIYHPEFLSFEILELVQNEIAGLGFTFLLMVFFLAASIGVGGTKWFHGRRWALSLLVTLKNCNTILSDMIRN
jgi:hypothetical protein